jgi:hypothetical protein
MRFQALMPDVLHWLGIQKIDNMVSMSDMYVLSVLFSRAHFLERLPHSDGMFPFPCSSTFVRSSGRCRIARLPCNDCHFNTLLPDLLRKYNAIVESGIPIHKRYDIPDHLIPPDSRVEIDAKIAAGYFTTGKQITQEDLAKTVGRTWEETEH